MRVLGAARLPGAENAAARPGEPRVVPVAPGPRGRAAATAGCLEVRAGEFLAACEAVLAPGGRTGEGADAHPLLFLVDRQGRLGDLPGSAAAVRVRAVGEGTSRVGARRGLLLADASLLRDSEPLQGVDIRGVPVEQESAARWCMQGLLDAAVFYDAPATAGWEPVPG